MKSFASISVFLAAWFTCGCGAAGQNAGIQIPGSPSSNLGGLPSLVPQQKEKRDPSSIQVGALIFEGDGASPDDATSIQGILDAHGITWKSVSSARLNQLSVDDLAQYGEIIWPGGYAKVQSDSLTSATRANIQTAIVDRGVGFVGHCAGAFITGSYGSWGLSLNPLNFPYYYLENQGTDTAMTDVTFPDGTHQNWVWYGGPTLNGFGSALAKYPTGDVAVAQAWVGRGLVIVTGPHPEAPVIWRTQFNLNDSDGRDVDLNTAAQYYQAVLEQKPLPSF